MGNLLFSIGNNLLCMGNVLSRMGNNLLCMGNVLPRMGNYLLCMENVLPDKVQIDLFNRLLYNTKKSPFNLYE